MLETNRVQNSLDSRSFCKETNMAEAAIQGTAKIYQFPVGGRSKSSEFRKQAYQEVAKPSPVMIIDECWYHSEAIRETDHS